MTWSHNLQYFYIKGIEILGIWLYAVFLYFLNNEKLREKPTITTLPGILVPLATQKPPISQSDSV